MRLLFASAVPLRSPAFRRYLLGATIVNLSLWAYITGLSWTLLTESGSAGTVSLLQTLMTVPLPLFMLPAGLLTDRFGSRPVMIVAYLGYMGCVGATAALALGNFSIPVALGLAFLLGCFDALNVVAAPVFVGRSVPTSQMGAAIGVATLAAGFGRILGGPLGGLLVGAFGAAGTLVPAAVLLAVATGVAFTLPRLTAASSAVRWRFGDLTAAIGWARATPLARTLIALGATMALFVTGYAVLLSVVAQDLLHAGPAELGLLTAAGGIGVLSAAFAIDPIGRRLGRGRTVIFAIVGCATLIAVLGAVQVFPAAALVVGLLSACSATFSATTSLLLQSHAPGNLRGRVIALYGLVYFSLQPIGLFGAGLAADRVGVGTALLAMSALSLASVGLIVLSNRSLWFATVPNEAAQPAAPNAAASDVSASGPKAAEP